MLLINGFGFLHLLAVGSCLRKDNQQILTVNGGAAPFLWYFGRRWEAGGVGEE